MRNTFQPKKINNTVSTSSMDITLGGNHILQMRSQIHNNNFRGTIQYSSQYGGGYKNVELYSKDGYLHGQINGREIIPYAITREENMDLANSFLDPHFVDLQPSPNFHYDPVLLYAISNLTQIIHQACRQDDNKHASSSKTEIEAVSIRKPGDTLSDFLPQGCQDCLNQCSTEASWCFWLSGPFGGFFCALKRSECMDTCWEHFHPCCPVPCTGFCCSPGEQCFSGGCCISPAVVVSCSAGSICCPAGSSGCIGSGTCCASATCSTTLPCCSTGQFCPSGQTTCCTAPNKICGRFCCPQSSPGCGSSTGCCSVGETPCGNFCCSSSTQECLLGNCIPKCLSGEERCGEGCCNGPLLQCCGDYCARFC